MFAMNELFENVFGWNRTRRAPHRPARVVTSKPLALEALEARELLAGDWFSTYIANVNIANLLRNDWNDHGSVTRNDMLAVFSQVERDGRVDASELDSLNFLASYGYLLNMTDAVQSLTGEVVSISDPANLYYQGGNLGYLTVNSPARQLQGLVDKWFLGMDHPTLAAGTTGSYQAVSGSLFGSYGPQYTDIYQGALGDCTYLSSLAETAARTDAINSMFTDNGDNTWTVRLYQDGTPVYVTVDNVLPDGGGLYDHPYGGILWAALAEKAVAQINEEGWLNTVEPGVNSYDAINNGNANTAVAALSLFSGQSTSAVSIATNAANIAAAMAAGELVVLGTPSTTAIPTIEHNHAYAVVGYDPNAAMPFTVFNPWGIKGGTGDNGQYIWGQFTANGAAIAANFVFAAHTGAAPEAEIAFSAGLWDSDRSAVLGTQTGSPQTPANGGSMSQPADMVVLALQSHGQPSDPAHSLARLHQHTASAVDQLFAEFDTTL
jgi:hypothetical protein